MSSTDEDEKCPICLCEFESPCFLDKCFHMFCYLCILQWNQVNPGSCPLCKRVSTSLIHDVRSEHEYQRYYFKDEIAKDQDKAKKSRESDIVKKNYLSKFGERSLPKTQDLETEKALRRAVYLRNIRAIDFVVKSSQQFSLKSFQKEPNKWERKLTPWVTREVQAILEEEDVHLLVTFILSVLQQYDIHSKEAKEQFKDILYDFTDTFIHEFIVFANSPYTDLASYDKHVSYDYSTARPSLRRKQPKTETEQLIPTEKQQEQSNDGEYSKAKRKLERLDAEVLKMKNELNQVQMKIQEKRQKLECSL